MEAAGKIYVHHYSRKDQFKIYDLSDLHLGNVGCAEDHIRSDVQDIQDDPFAFWLGGGDYADHITFDDKRFEPKCAAPWIQLNESGDIANVLNNRVFGHFDKIKHRCFGLLYGNHERTLMVQKNQAEMHANLCERLKVTNLGYSCLLDIVFARTRKPDDSDAPCLLSKFPPKTEYHASAFRIFAHHGAGGSTTPVGKITRLRRFMDDFDADIYFVGHVHDLIAVARPQIAADSNCRTLVAKGKIGVIAGGYLRTYTQGATGYGEVRGYSPTTLGAAWVRISPETRQASAEIKIEV